MIDAHVHLEKGDYSVEWINQFVAYAVKRNIDKVYFLEHTHIFKECRNLYNEMSVYNEYHLVRENYASSNLEAINYMKENIQDGDIIIYNRINMAILNTYFPDNTQYFLNFGHWGIHEAYKAYAPSMKIVEDWNFLNDFYGRIWIMDSEDSTYVYDNIDKNIVETVGECKHFEAAYHGYKYDITLVEKK